MTAKSQATNVVCDCGTSCSRCGYCGGGAGFHSHGMYPKSPMTVQTYQDLLDLGWRRSGDYLYKPNLALMCCPAYTIRLEVAAFSPDKRQRRVLRKLQQYLDGGPLSAEYSEEPTRSREAAPVSWRLVLLERVMREALRSWRLKEGLPQVDCEISVKVPSAKQLRTLPEGTLASSPSCISLFHALKSHSGEPQYGSASELAAHFSQSLVPLNGHVQREDCSLEQQRRWESLLSPISAVAVNGHLNFVLEEGAVFSEAEAEELMTEAKRRNRAEDSAAMEAEATRAGKSALHRSELPAEFCSPLERRRSFTTELVPSSYLEEEYRLYKRYQMAVHGDSAAKCSPSQYRRFLVDSPLVPVVGENGRAAFGSFHIQYRIDGRLVAVGAVDVLPRCLSSKYLFWDPDFAPLALGKVSALKEIELTQELGRRCTELRYYYMGFYIESCPKMRYKGDYAPSELLCPVTYGWVELTDAVRQRLKDDAYLDLTEVRESERRENAVSRPESATGVEGQRVHVEGVITTLGDYVARLRREASGDSGLGEFFSFFRGGTEAASRYAAALTAAVTAWREVVKNVSSDLIYEFGPW